MKETAFEFKSPLQIPRHILQGSLLRGIADQLTLFEPGTADYPHLSLLAPQCFSPSGITVIHTSFLPSKWNLYLKLQFLA